jgi:hypothetical protein
MNIVEINLNLVSIPLNNQPNNVRPCPRVNLFKHPYDPADITQTGNYNQSFVLENGDRCGLDIFHWHDNYSQIIVDDPNVKITTQIVGDKKDQIKKSINITESGKYNISVAIFQNSN